MRSFLSSIGFALGGGGVSTQFAGLVVFTFVSEDLACITAGLLVAQGSIGYGTATLACFLGIFLGDVGLYAIGRAFGEHVVHRRPFRWFLRPAKLEMAKQWFQKRGAAIILSSRFMPGSRLPTYIVAGTLRVNLRTFIGWFALAAAIWTPLLVAVAVWLGEVIVHYYRAFGLAALPTALFALFLFYLFSHVLPGLLTHRGRRLAYGRWQRFRCWEFWPWWIVYTPVIGWILYLAFVRYRHSPSVFTLVNPAIPYGGMVGESKSAILRGLDGAGDVVAQWAQIPATDSLERRIERFEAFRRDRQLNFPIVLKPDAGERGEGVQILKSAEAAEVALAGMNSDHIVQAFAPGREFGVFYARDPLSDTGIITGITDKRFTSVTGDGRRTLEELILDDARAVCMASYFLAQHSTALEEIVEEGRVVQLTEVGTHARGSLFLDGSHLVTPELTREIDRISRQFDGFFFGRYDIRCPSEAALREGRELKVIELNGLTSEGTWMYDPKHSFRFALNTLCHHWSLAFAIGEANLQAGFKPTPPAEVWRLMGRFLIT